MGFLDVRLEVCVCVWLAGGGGGGGGGGEVGKTTCIKPPLCIKLFKIMLETSNLTRKYPDIYSFRKYTFRGGKINPPLNPEKLTLPPL